MFIFEFYLNHTHNYKYMLVLQPFAERESHLAHNLKCRSYSKTSLNPVVHFWLHHTAHCAERMVSAACVRVLLQQKWWNRGRWVASSCAHGGCCESAMVGTGWAISHHGQA